MEKTTPTTFLAGLGVGATGLVLATALFRTGRPGRIMASRVRDKVEPSPYKPSKINGHLAQPGPLYWDFKCLVCDFPVAEHSFWGWLWARIRGWK